MNIPHDAVIHDSKSTYYLVEPRPYDDKSKYLSQSGFKKEPADRLKGAIPEQVVETDAIPYCRNEYGIFYQVEGDLTGVNGRKLSVVTIWLQGHNDGKMHFVTLIPLKGR